MSKNIYPCINLRVNTKPGKNIFLLNNKLYTGTFPEDSYQSLISSVKIMFPKLEIKCLKFKEEIITENYCPDIIFRFSDASLFEVYPIEICL